VAEVTEADDMQRKRPAKSGRTGLSASRLEETLFPAGVSTKDAAIRAFQIYQGGRETMAKRHFKHGIRLVNG